MSNPTEISSEYSDPLLNLSSVQTRVDSLRDFLSESLNNNRLISQQQLCFFSDEIAGAIHQTISNVAALLSSTFSPSFSPDCSYKSSSLKEEEEEGEFDKDCEIVELDAAELLTEHVHFCEICGKGFRRDANLRMHMRAHGNQYKTPQALAKPHTNGGETASLKRRFSCPYQGCNRNKRHKKFRPLKSVICVKNHFKRSHCPKMYACNRCNKKSFSVVADLKGHLKHCGESRWKCSCGTTFSRKDKLFGHMALFEGHTPAVASEEEIKTILEEEDEVVVASNFGDEFFEGLDLDAFADVDGYSLQDMLNLPNVNGW